VGYEYHAGQFIPCAPYGKGYGNIAVLCNDECKSIKDSGISIQDLYKLLATHTVLWQNTSGNFASQDITLASDDWDFLIIETTGGTITISQIENTTTLTYPFWDKSYGDGIGFYQRGIFVRANKTAVWFGNCKSCFLRQDGNYTSITTSENNAFVVPKIIYGVKLGVTI
jgi:hypothetical protein